MSDEDNKTRISNLFSNQASSPPEGGMFDSTAKIDEMSASAAPADSVTQDANPFASEFKTGEASQLSMEMSAFSQFFKDGSGSSGRRIALMAGVALIVGLGLFMFMGGDPEDGGDSSALVSDDDGFDEEEDDDFDDGYGDDSFDEEDDDFADEDSSSEDDYDEEEDSYLSDDEESEEGMSSFGAEGAPELLVPANGQVRDYDETSEYALFEWSGEPGGRLILSRSDQMFPVERSVMVTGNSYRLAHPWPGTWYWQVENNAGPSEVSYFTVDPPVRRQVVLAPLASPLSGSNGVVSWSGDTKVARYSIELSQSGWSQPQWRYQTSGTAVTLQNVTPGQYQLRVGAFSEVSGRWEYTTPTPVTIE